MKELENRIERREMEGTFLIPLAQEFFLKEGREVNNSLNFPNLIPAQIEGMEEKGYFFFKILP